MRRRTFIAGLGAAVWPLVANAQPTPIIGFLSGRSATTDAPLLAAYRTGLSEAGLVEGRQFTIKYAPAEGRSNRLRMLAADLVRANVSLILAGDSASAQAASDVTKTTPVVFFSGGDPVQLGLVASYNRPGGNLTGVAQLGHALIAKRLDLLRDFASNVGAIGFVQDSGNPSASGEAEAAAHAAFLIGRPLVVFKIASEGDFYPLSTWGVDSGVHALLFGASPLFTNNARRLTDLANQGKIPAIYNLREFALVGGLASWADLRDGFRLMGKYSARILNGDQPGDLPVAQPTKFELVVNLTTAKSLSLDIPPSLLARADEVIE